ncbi:DNA internalization-related competence protein ComEC/Rec2 [Pseudoalteromonas sp. MMG010]|uniref:DNA internalization-related competence protein ComEC/Rec2 n=1 Tax=Pseudoalteromonas sp. MMG010 TaxID=2822685 RepID=UPI0032B57E07
MEDLAENQPVTVRLSVSEVISQQSPQYVKAKIMVLADKHFNQFTAPHTLLSITNDFTLNRGDSFNAEVVLKPYRTIKNFVNYDPHIFAFTQRIFFKGKVVNNSMGKITASEKGQKENYRNYVINTFKNTQLHWLYFALLTGDKSHIAFNDKELLQHLGLSHLLAISGLHIGLVFGFGFLLAKYLLLSLNISFTQHVNISILYSGFGFLLAFIYVYLSDFLVSASRALLMLGCYLLLYYFSKNAMRWRTILFALVILLLFNPFAVLNPGLYFSFIAVAIIFFVIEKKGGGHTGPFRSIVSLFVIQLALFIGLLPLSLYFFNGVSIVGLIINLIAIGFVSVVLMPALFVVILISSMVDLSVLVTLLDTGCQFIYECLIQIPKKWQWYSFEKMSLFDVVMSYLCLLFALSPVKKLILIPLLTWVFNVMFIERAQWELNVFDVGHGLMVLITENNSAFVYDFGPSYFNRFSRINNVLLPYIKKNQLTVNYSVLSHSDNDHRGGLSHFLNAGYKQSFATFHPKGVDKHCVTQQVVLDSQVQIKSFNSVDLKDKNDNSCVIRVSNNHFSVLLTGDISKRREKYLLNENKHLNSTVLISAHHGSKTSSSTAFINAVMPSIVIHSSAYKGQWQFPNKDVVARFNQIFAKQYITGQHGQVRIKFFANKLIIETAREDESYWFIKD